MASRQAGRKKARTREHIIGDLAVNQVEKQILLRGFSLERVVHDYGYDAIVFVYNSEGEPGHGLLYFQIKGTDAPVWIDKEKMLTFRLERRHLLHWLSEPMPVILCVYHALTETTYWLYVQSYIHHLADFNLFTAGETVTVRIPCAQILTPEVVGEFAVHLERIQKQLEGMVFHE